MDEPHIQSRAALVMLMKYYAKLDKTIFNPFKWLDFRRKYLTELKKKNGTIKCHYCPKDNLQIETKDKARLATIDHVHPVSKGGALFDLDNLVPACYSCNMNKGDKIL